MPEELLTTDWIKWLALGLTCFLLSGSLAMLAVFIDAIRNIVRKGE